MRRVTAMLMSGLRKWIAAMAAIAEVTRTRDMV